MKGKKIVNAKGLKHGDIVRWSSQAMGSTTEKEGKVLFHLPKGEHVADAAKGHGVEVPMNRRKFDARSTADVRVVVAVEVKGKRTTRTDYYAPPYSRLEKRGFIITQPAKKTSGL